MTRGSGLVSLHALRMLRSHGVNAAALATLHAIVVAWVAWYLAEAVWAALPLSASPAPLPSLVFRGAWLAGAALALVVGLAVGAVALRGAWLGADPTRVLPEPPAARVLAAWIVSVIVVAVVDAAPLPVYAALHELGALAWSEVSRALSAHLAVIVLSPLGGIGAALALGPRGGPW